MSVSCDRLWTVLYLFRRIAGEMLRVLAVCIVAASGVSPPDEAQKLSDEFHEFVDDSLDTWSVMPDYFKRSQALKQRVPATR